MWKVKGHKENNTSQVICTTLILKEAEGRPANFWGCSAPGRPCSQLGYKHSGRWNCIQHIGQLILWNQSAVSNLFPILLLVLYLGCEAWTERCRSQVSKLSKIFPYSTKKHRLLELVQREKCVDDRPWLLSQTCSPQCYSAWWAGKGTQGFGWKFMHMWYCLERKSKWRWSSLFPFPCTASNTGTIDHNATPVEAT